VPRQPSRRARITATVAAHTLRPITRMVPGNALGLAFTRGVLAGSLHAFGTRSRSTVIPVDEPVLDSGRVVGEWVRPRHLDADAARTDAVILYIHGSAYVGCSTSTHRGLVSRIAEQTGLDVFSVEYRLAPRHVFPAAVDDVARAHGWLLDQGVSPHRIILMGDSAGGHLAVDLALHLVRSHEAPPAALAVFSPLVDHSFALSRRRERLRPDPLVTAADAQRLIDRYVGHTDITHPRLTHVFAAGEVLPPTLIQAGGGEMLVADAHALHDALAAAGTPVTLEVWPGQIHVFQAMPRLVPEADAALRRATDFVTRAAARARLSVVDDASGSGMSA